MARQLPLAHPLAARQPDLPIKLHGVNLLTLPAIAKREKVDDFYAARTANTTALPWSNFAPPFSDEARESLLTHWLTGKTAVCIASAFVRYRVGIFVGTPAG